MCRSGISAAARMYSISTNWYCAWSNNLLPLCNSSLFFFFQAEDGIRYLYVTGVQTCVLPISATRSSAPPSSTCSRSSRPTRRRRSEERRVGKECRCRWSPYHLKKKNKNEIYHVEKVQKGMEDIHYDCLKVLK